MTLWKKVSTISIQQPASVASVTTSSVPGYGTGVVRQCQVSPSLIVSPISAISSVNAIAGNNNDMATFQFKFSIKAVGCDAYISANPSWITNGQFDGLESLQSGMNIYWYGVSFGWLSADNLTATTQNGNWKITAGTQENFTAYFTSRTDQVGGPGMYRGFLKQIRWNITNSATAFRIFTNGLGTPTTTTPFTTPYIQVN